MIQPVKENLHLLQVTPRKGLSSKPLWTSSEARRRKKIENQESPWVLSLELRNRGSLWLTSEAPIHLIWEEKLYETLDKQLAETYWRRQVQERWRQLRVWCSGLQLTGDPRPGSDGNPAPRWCSEGNQRRFWKPIIRWRNDRIHRLTAQGGKRRVVQQRVRRRWFNKGYMFWLYVMIDHRSHKTWQYQSH